MIALALRRFGGVLKAQLMPHSAPPSLYCSHTDEHVLFRPVHDAVWAKILENIYFSLHNIEVRPLLEFDVRFNAG